MRRLLPGRGLSASGALDDSALNAVGAWYVKRGYQAAGPTAAQRAQLRQLEQAVTTAKGGTAAGSGDGAQALAAAESDLAEFRKTYGISIASGEILFLPKLPVRLTTVTVKAGAPASGAIGTVADPALIVNGDVATEDADLIKVGMTATMEHPSGGTFAATLSMMGAAAAAPSDEGASTADAPATGTPVTGTPIRLRPKDPAKLTPFAGQALKITIKVGGTGHAVLAVPVAAVFTASDGQARVTVQDAAGAVHDVAVEAGLTTGGYVQVTPAPVEALHTTDRVVVGTR
jgi:hypothetical protein